MDSGALDTLVARARAAQRSLSAMDLEERLTCSRRAGAAIAADGEAIVAQAVVEARQPVRFARRELATALGFVEALPALSEAIRPGPVPAASGETTLEWAPYGVVLGWHAANSPVWVPTLVALSALVGGNAALCRPSSRVPRTSGRVLAAIAGEWPEDAVQVAALSRAEAEPLLWHEGVDAIVAHASSETCKHHLALLGEAYAHGARLRPYIPEGSGNDAFLVLEGADLARAAGALATAAFANSGQLCMAAKRVIVLEDVWPALRAPLAEAVAALRIGPPEREDTDVTPLGPGRALERARADLAEALDAGGTIVAGAGEHDGELTPTVVALSRDARHVRLWREESFGPIRSLVLARDEDEAVSLANETRFGLGAAVFGGSRDVAARLRGARIVVEEGPLYQDPHLVVGGVGDSGLGGARPKLEQLVYARRVHRGGAG